MNTPTFVEELTDDQILGLKIGFQGASTLTAKFDRQIKSRRKIGYRLHSWSRTHTVVPTSEFTYASRETILAVYVFDESLLHPDQRPQNKIVWKPEAAAAAGRTS